MSLMLDISPFLEPSEVSNCEVSIDQEVIAEVEIQSQSDEEQGRKTIYFHNLHNLLFHILYMIDVLYFSNLLF